ncbi:two-component sensor histidine kinase [Dissulfuribacter thermophilus]|uniref:histidine kinase n=1 Tax=Dissulfuribacter thermophilus TaxID=1156395 RepID=A0A1B9F5I5_9BACT|nr:HAMP domain-containing sensor histidine kinase [Dissulfuribacter thermophilus]OCC15208.1 two-component sensor histidine kinase [Dissulfuribacter thermophilus]
MLNILKSYLNKAQKKETLLDITKTPSSHTLYKDLFLFLIEKTLHGVIVINKNKHIVHINKVAIELLKLPQNHDYWKGKSILEVIRSRSLLQHDPPLTFTFKTHWGETLSVDYKPFKFNDIDELTILLIQKKRTTEDPESILKGLSDAAHQFRTPLASIQGYAETLLEQKDIPEEKKEEFLALIIKNTERLTNIIKHILLLSRIRRGLSSDTIKNFDIIGLINEITELYENVKFMSDTDRLLVKGHPDLTQIALNSIIENAVQYGGEDQEVLLTIQESSEFVAINIIDHGPGIPLDSQKKIFNRFFRVKETKKLHPEGTGLGLSIAKEIALAQGGDITVESQWGKGSKFTFLIPRL